MDLTFILFFWGWCTLLFWCGEVQCEYLGMFPKWSCPKLAKCPNGQGSESLERSTGNEVEALSGHCHIPGGWRLACPEPGGNLPFRPRVCGCVCMRGSTQMSDLRRNPVPEEEDQPPPGQRQSHLHSCVCPVFTLSGHSAFRREHLHKRP